MNGWAAGLVIACLLMIPSPPTAQLGQAGWIAAIGIQALSLSGWIALRLRPARRLRRAPARHLAAPDRPRGDAVARRRLVAPYHELYLPALILGSAGLPLRRFAPFAAAVLVLALLPALYAPDRDGLVRMLTELAVWSFVIGALAVLMERIRGQARLARSDVLTQLGNRRALEEQFEVPRTATITLGIGDLDGFKQVNDRHGHLAGDACLAEVGRTLAQHARAGDQVFRWGGDEFAVLLPGTPPEPAHQIFERLERAVADHVRDPDGTPIRITFGWAGGDGDTDLRTLTALADAALLSRKPSSARRA